MIYDIKKDYVDYLDVTLRMSRNLYESFEEACDRKGEDTKEVMLGFMKSYIESVESEA